MITVQFFRTDPVAVNVSSQAALKSEVHSQVVSGSTSVDVTTKIPHIIHQLWDSYVLPGEMYVGGRELNVYVCVCVCVCVGPGNVVKLRPEHGYVVKHAIG